jgi:hypothetical protein
MVLNGKTPHSSREVKVSGVFFSSGVDADFDVIFTPTGPWENPTKPFLGAGKNHSRDCTSRYKFLCFPPFHICRFLHRASSRSWIWSSLWTGQLLHAPSNEDQMRFVCVCACVRVCACVLSVDGVFCALLWGVVTRHRRFVPGLRNPEVLGLVRRSVDRFLFPCSVEGSFLHRDFSLTWV